MALAFAATADRPTAVLTGPNALAGHRPGLIRLPRPTVTHEMVRVDLEDHPLTATAALVWSGDLPRPLQQILFETADGITSPAPPRSAALARRALADGGYASIGGRSWPGPPVFTSPVLNRRFGPPRSWCA